MAFLLDTDVAIHLRDGNHAVTACIRRCGRRATDTRIIAGNDRRHPSQWLRRRAMLGLGKATVE